MAVLQNKSKIMNILSTHTHTYTIALFPGLHHKLASLAVQKVGETDGGFPT